ncbi:hypothetical protein AB0L50_15525 [Streptomyces flaveolus]
MGAFQRVVEETPELRFDGPGRVAGRERTVEPPDHRGRQCFG